MGVSFEQITVGTEYTRSQLAEMWGYAGYEAISRGIVTPRNTAFIIMFITEEKQESLTQYEDRLENGILHIEGETNHAADERIISAESADDEIHLFYRIRHHMPFIYYAQIHLERYEQLTNRPSRFKIRVPTEHQTTA